MQEDPGMQLIWDIRKKLYEEMQTMSPDEWDELVHQRAEIVKQRIAAIKVQEESKQQPVESGR